MAQDIEFQASHGLHHPGQDTHNNHFAAVLLAAFGEVGQGPSGARKEDVLEIRGARQHVPYCCCLSRIYALILAGDRQGSPDVLKKCGWYG